MKDIKNIIFDLGGVIVDLDIPSTIAAFGKLGMMPQGITLEEITNGGVPRDWEMYRVMHAMDIGDMNRAQFVQVMSPRCNQGTRDEDILAAMNSILVFHKHRMEWLLQLKKHYRLFLLSNIGDIHWDETQRITKEMGTPIEECFEQMFLSYQLRMTKPDPRIFQHLLKETGISPSETLYIDDLPDNIQVGKELGLQVLKVNTNNPEEKLPMLFPDLLNENK